eukprot:TRINITY_DN17529_c0_g1_i2.p1 TRINITY_DN17529_c0_g1~~TRINITY_DN17529_c0_g1_i2.p1  ORF type:complete len:248 (+),score=25.34 TRINITY_DN17529_c0_g1_i2:244-987(+)
MHRYTVLPRERSETELRQKKVCLTCRALRISCVLLLTLPGVACACVMLLQRNAAQAVPAAIVSQAKLAGPDFGIYLGGFCFPWADTGNAGVVKVNLQSEHVLSVTGKSKLYLAFFVDDDGKMVREKIDGSESRSQHSSLDIRNLLSRSKYQGATGNLSAKPTRFSIDLYEHLSPHQWHVFLLGADLESLTVNTVSYSMFGLRALTSWGPHEEKPSSCPWSYNFGGGLQRLLTKGQNVWNEIGSFVSL